MVSRDLSINLPLVKIILKNSSLFFPERIKFSIIDRLPHFPEKIEKKVKVMDGIQSHREDFPAHKHVPQICP